MNHVRAELTKDHEEIEALLQCLAQDAAAPCPGPLEATWDAFEGRLLCHMEAEERFLLPLIEASDPAERDRIRCEHASIRTLVAELGIAIELHTVREAHIAQLVQFLRAHAKHEDRALYELAGRKASTAVEHSLLESLRGTLQVTHRDSASSHRARP